MSDEVKDSSELFALVNEYRMVLKRCQLAGSTHDLVDAHRIAAEIDQVLSTTDCGPRTAPTIRPGTELVRGLAIGLDKTELDEEEAREFLRFVEEADKKKTGPTIRRMVAHADYVESP